MRWFVVAVLTAFLASASYLASPFWSAWSLREAIRTGDVPTLERKVDWERVRESLRQSLRAIQKGSPSEPQITPSLWQRGKAAASALVVDRMVESYVTPAGLPILFARHQQLRGVTGAAEPDAATRPWHERVADFYRRVKRAEFQTPARVEIEVADRYAAERRYIGVLELTGFEWKLTGLRIVIADARAARAP
jgi:hypothetical protein